MNYDFDNDLSLKLKLSLANDYTDNWDGRRFGNNSLTIRQQLRSTVKNITQRIGLRLSVRKILTIHKKDIQWLYERLADSESRELLLSVMAYRILGHRKVKLPLNTSAYWNELDELEISADTNDCIELDFLEWKVCRNDLKDYGYPVQVYARASGVMTQFLLQQYRCVTEGHTIEANDGDTVIDCGGCYGDTALYFACKAGQHGKVYSFEFMPNNLSVFNRNLTCNPAVGSRVEIIPHPVWACSGETLYIEGHGPATNVTKTPKTIDINKVSTLCIDNLVHQRLIKHINFIKMDIEGSELEALRGAEQTIRRDKPKLAISVYHKLQDFWEIPQWIDTLNLGYRFYIRHFTIHSEETVLFAEVTE